MKRILVVIVLAGGLVLPLLAQQTAVVKSFTGKVQLRPAGATEWVDATPGATVAQGTVVSTGFSSTAVLDLGTSTIQVQQLTRMRLDQLLRKANNVTTSVYLTVGAVHTDVDNVAGLTQAFTLKSPVSTAAVRGTVFDFDGTHLTVERGVVEFFNDIGLSRSVAAGQSSQLNGVHLPGTPADSAASGSEVSTQTGPGSAGTTGVTGPHGATGSIVITIS